MHCTRQSAAVPLNPVTPLKPINLSASHSPADSLVGNAITVCIQRPVIIAMTRQSGLFGTRVINIQVAIIIAVLKTRDQWTGIRRARQAIPVGILFDA